MTHTLVIGAAGEVGRDIVSALLADGHEVLACGRDPTRLQGLAADLGAPARLRLCPGSLESEAKAEHLRAAVLALAPTLRAVVVCVNAPREQTALLDQSSQAFAQRIQADLLTHFTAARVFLPCLAPGGVFLGIGGGSADFVLDHGVHMSVAQAGLRMFYRGLAHECAVDGRAVQVRELVVASVVNSRSTQAFADPSWVSALDIGQQVAAMVRDPQAFPDPIWRIARRDASGRPVLTSEGPTRVQGLRQVKEVH